jgi:hypothetical protein
MLSSTCIALVILFSLEYLVMQRERNLVAETEKLQKALDEIKTLVGIIPICSSCKKIRCDKGYWNRVEQHIDMNIRARFSHALCQNCLKELYPGTYERFYGQGTRT